MQTTAEQTTTTREQRVEIINKIVAEIAARGRCFFKAKRDRKTDGHFVIKNDKLYWHEEYRNKPMRPIERNRHLCSHGRTLWAQLLAFTRYIEEGRKWYMFSEHWGYPEEDVKAIHELAKELGYLL